MNSDKNIRISLVGAGPGDPQLLTLAGKSALETADVVLYDFLVNETLLEYASGARHIYVGKRRGQKGYKQAEINDLLITSARLYGHAVRLKGGDNFVFGRGFEEKLAAEEAGIPVAVVPGISSSLAVPAAANIPVTHRGLATSFHVVTATLANGQLNEDLKEVLALQGTTVILMGLAHLHAIAQWLIEHGKADKPLAVISNGTCSNQKQLVGTAASISAQWEQQPLPSPAIIVVGEVVQFAHVESDLTAFASLSANHG